MVALDSVAQPFTLPETGSLPKEDNLKWGSVKLGEILKKGVRLEASVFGIEGRRARELLLDCGYPIKQLCGPNGLAEAFYPTRFKRNYIERYSPGAVGFIGSSEMLQTRPEPIKFLKKSEGHPTEVKYGYILLSRSGTIGNVTFVNRTLEKYFVSEHAIRIVCKEFPGYVYAFLKSKLGRVLIETNKYGAVVDQIEPEHLYDVPIPDPSNELKEKIHNLIIRSFELRDESNRLIDESQTLLKKELMLPDIEEIGVIYFDSTADVDTYTVPLSKLEGRIDPSYHIPLVDSIKTLLKENAKEVTILDDPRISQKFIAPGRFKRVYMKEGQGIVFFGGKQLYELDPTNKKYLSFKHHEKRIKEELILHHNMVLITCSGTVGRVNITPKHWDGWTANQHIIRVVPSSDNIAGYLWIWLSSEYAYPLITRFIYGAVVDELEEEHVKQIPIPLLKDPSKQKNINDLALKANLKRTEAYLLEQEAIRTLNEEIIYRKIL